MLQQHITFKQLQELQRQQQLKELGDVRQQNYINQLSVINKQASRGQFQPLINGTPIHDASQVFMVGDMNLVPQGAPPVQAFTNGLVFSQAQTQALRLQGLVPQQPDISFYGTPTTSAGNNLSQYSLLQAASHDSDNGQVYMSDGAFLTKQVCQEKKRVGQAPIHGLNNGVLRGNFQVNSLPNASVQEFIGSQEQGGWPGHFVGKTTKNDPSQGLASLDPLEEKILFNMDDKSWEASFGRHRNVGTGGESALEHTDHLSAFPSIQSGSWSALMQSAVAEATSSDTGLQEEWSGLSFQNPEQSTDNQPPNLLDCAIQQTNWVDNRLQSASPLSSNPELQINDTKTSSGFPIFKHSGIHFSSEQREQIRADSYHGPIQQSPTNACEWLSCNPQRKRIFEGSHPAQELSPWQNAWASENYMHSESDAHHRSISSYTNGSQPCNNLTGDIHGGMSKHPDGLWKTDNTYVESTTRVDQTVDGKTNQHLLRNNQLNYMKHGNHSVKNRGNESHDLGNSSQVLFNSYKGGSKTYEQPENCLQKEISSDSYHSNASQHTITRHKLRENVWLHGSDPQHLAGGSQKPCGQVLQGLNDHEQRYAGTFKFVDNAFNSGMNLEKGHSPGIQRNSKASEETPHVSDGESNISAVVKASFRGSNATAHISQNMLELLHKVDESREHRTGMHFVSMDLAPLSEVPPAETPDVSAAQSYNKSSASQYFGLKLAPPSQPLANSSGFDSSQNSLQMENSAAMFPYGPPSVRNLNQNQDLPAAPIACQSPSATLPSMTRRFLAFNPATSQDTSHLIGTKSYGQQFPILESVPVIQPSVMPSISQQDVFPVKPPNLWANIPTKRHLSVTEPSKVPSSLLPCRDSTNSSLETASGAPQDLHDQNCIEGGNNSQELGTYSLNSQGFDHGSEQSGKERSNQLISLEILDPISQLGRLSHGQEYVTKCLSEVNDVASNSWITTSCQQGLDRARHNDIHTPVTSTRDLAAFGHSLRPPNKLHQNYSLMHQMNSMKNVETDPSRMVSANYNGVDSDLNVQQVTAVAGQNLLNELSSGVQGVVNGELNAVSQPNSFPFGSDRVLHFSSEARRDQPVQASSRPLPQDIPRDMVSFGQNDSHIQSNVASNRAEQSQTSLQMRPPWFKHYETLKNGQMLPIFDPRSAKNAMQQFSLGQPFENMCMNSSAGGSQVSTVWPTTPTTSVAVKHASPPCVLPSDLSDQSLAVIRPKKRKISALKLLPWHKEGTQAFERLKNISTAELEWAQAANRLGEKVEDEAEMIEDVLSMLRPKKRLILTTMLMQQMFRPAPAVILSADAISNCDSMVYFAARLALGDACSLTSDYHMSDTRDISSEKPKTSERVGEQDFSNIVEDFINQAKMLESELLRLDKSASILDIRVESQALEKFSVINRFAKFHSRAQVGAAEASSSSDTTATVPKAFPQRYVTAVLMPRTVPEGAQCFLL